MLYEELTARILSACFQVSNELGAGFLENVYQNALFIALREKGLTVLAQYPFSVMFHGESVGNYHADFLVDDLVILEIKAVSILLPEHMAQVINYLKATGVEIGLLVNFGRPKLEYKRLERQKIKS